MILITELNLVLVLTNFTITSELKTKIAKTQPKGSLVEFVIESDWFAKYFYLEKVFRINKKC